MRSTRSVEITSDGRTVWINGADGNIGRFGARGIDVHTTITEQLNGASQCLACSHGIMHLADWRQFQMLMRSHHAVAVDDVHMPDFIRNEISEHDQETHQTKKTANRKPHATRTISMVGLVAQSVVSVAATTKR